MTPMKGEAMAKKKAPPKPKKPGVFVRMLKWADRQADRAAKVGKEKKVRTASYEWQNGTRLVKPELTPKIQPPTYYHYTEEDQERWGVFIQGVWVEFTRWPEDRTNLRLLAIGAAEKRFGVYAQSWQFDESEIKPLNRMAELSAYR